MKFTKYDKHGAYHWKQYAANTKYTRHVDRILAWITETNVLDVGAGDGLITKLLNATGIDDEPTGVRLAQEHGANVLLASAYSLPYPPDSFNAVLMADVIEHFEHPDFALKEARRVAPVLYITTPERGMVNDKFHITEWTRDELPIFMQHHGWNLDGEVLVIPAEKNMYARFTR